VRVCLKMKRIGFGSVLKYKEYYGNLIIIVIIIQSLWDLWWTKWPSNSFFPRTLASPFRHHCIIVAYTFIRLSSRYIMLAVDRVMGRVAQSVQRLATGCTVRGSNPGGGEIFRTCPPRPWSPPSLLYNGYRVFPGGKERSGRNSNPTPPSNAVGHERVELYLYSQYGPYGLYRASVPVQGVHFTFFFTDSVT